MAFAVNFNSQALVPYTLLEPSQFIREIAESWLKENDSENIEFVNSISVEDVFPFRSILPYDNTEIYQPLLNSSQFMCCRVKIKELFRQQIIKLYNHCILNNDKRKKDDSRKPPRSCFVYKSTFTLHFDLAKKEVQLEGKHFDSIDLKFSNRDLEPRTQQECTFGFKAHPKETYKLYYPFTIDIVEDQIPLPYFDGKEVEITRHDREKDDDLMKDEDWDHWQERNLIGVCNYQFIYFALTIAIKKIHSIVNSQKLHILDLGSGEGDLASKIEPYPFVEKIYLVERNKTLFSLAKKHFSTKEKVELFNRDITLCDYQEILKGKKVDIIILCGIIAHQVLSREDSYKVLEKCKPILKKNGFVLIASFSYKYFSTPDYEKMGYDVLNANFPYRFIDSPTSFEPLYVLRMQKHTS